MDTVGVISLISHVSHLSTNTKPPKTNLTRVNYVNYIFSYPLDLGPTAATDTYCWKSISSRRTLSPLQSEGKVALAIQRARRITRN